MGLLDDQKKSIKDKYFRFWDIVELLANKNDQNWYEIGQFLGHINISKEITSFTSDDFHRIHDLDYDNYHVDNLIKELMDIYPFDSEEEIKKKTRSLRLPAIQCYWLKDDLYNFHPIATLNILPPRPIRFTKAVEPELTGNSDPELLVKAIGIKNDAISRLQEVNREQEERIEKLISEQNLLVSVNNVPNLLYLKPYLSMDDAACIISDDSPIEIDICKNDTNFRQNFSDYLGAYAFIRAAAESDVLENVNYKIQRSHLQQYLARQGIIKQGFNDNIEAMPLDQFGVVTIGTPDTVHYQRHRDQLQIELNQAQQRIAELQGQLELVKGTSDVSLTGIKAINDKKRDAQGMAKIIAVHLWSQNEHKNVLIGEMADKVYRFMVDYCKDLLPEKAESLKIWIRSIAPMQAQRKGRPSTKTVS